MVSSTPAIWRHLEIIPKILSGPLSAGGHFTRENYLGGLSYRLIWPFTKSVLFENTPDQLRPGKMENTRKKSKTL